MSRIWFPVLVSGLGVLRGGVAVRWGIALIGLRSAFAGVVVDVPAGSGEAEGGGGHGADEFAAALGTLGFRLGAEALDLVEAVAARGAAVFIHWQGKFLREKTLFLDFNGFVNWCGHGMRFWPRIAGKVSLAVLRRSPGLKPS